MLLLIPSFWIQHLSPSHLPVVTATNLGLITSPGGGLNETIHTKHLAEWPIARPQQVLGVFVIAVHSIPDSQYTCN